MRPGGPTERSLHYDLLGTLGSKPTASAARDEDRLRWPDRSGLGSFSLLGFGRVAGRCRHPRQPTKRRPSRRVSSSSLDKIERHQRNVVKGWREQGMTDAARHLEHFLDGSGEPITYNRDQARSFDPVRSAEEDAQEQIRMRILAEAQELKDGESKKLDLTERGEHDRTGHGLDVLRGYFGDTDRLNDNFATGKTNVESAFTGTISRRGNEIVVDGLVDQDWHDTYDFRRGQPGAGAAHGLERHRGAKPYTFGGRWRQALAGSIARDDRTLTPTLHFTDRD